jgi:hypothetical protein
MLVLLSTVSLLGGHRTAPESLREECARASLIGERSPFAIAPSTTRNSLRSGLFADRPGRTLFIGLLAANHGASARL